MVGANWPEGELGSVGDYDWLSLKGDAVVMISAKAFRCRQSSHRKWGSGARWWVQVVWCAKGPIEQHRGRLLERRVVDDCTDEAVAQPVDRYSLRAREESALATGASTMTKTRSEGVGQRRCGQAKGLGVGLACVALDPPRPGWA